MAIATAHKIKMASLVGGYFSSVLSGLGSPPGAKRVAGGACSGVQSESSVPFPKLDRVSTTPSMVDSRS
jgi:hypothetical protein